MTAFPLGRKFTALDENKRRPFVYPGRQVRLGELSINRLLPNRERRLVGPWCFLDRFGPLAFSSGRAMDVPPHPHIGLQTVSWLQEGEILHTDSLGCEAVVRPGGVNVMTAGRGISHTEETPVEHSGRLSGVQLWAALPDAVRNMEPSFVHVSETPGLEMKGGVLRVFSGAVRGAASPASHYSGILGLEAHIHPGESLEMELDEGYEHAVLLLEGDADMEGLPLEEEKLYYLGGGRGGLEFSSRAGGRVLLIGGTPFQEPILMWWNFVARTPEELLGARNAWEAGDYFGAVPGVHGERLPAPPPTRFARPNPVS